MGRKTRIPGHKGRIAIQVLGPTGWAKRKKGSYARHVPEYVHKALAFWWDGRGETSATLRVRYLAMSSGRRGLAAGMS